MIPPVVSSLRGRDFLDVADLGRADLRRILDLAHDIKAGQWKDRPLQGRHMAMLFQKPSHRTRVSFEVGISHGDLVKLAEASEKPVINALTDRSHPCQILADLMTLEEVGGELASQHVVYVGDGNNIANSLIEASALMGFQLTVVSPPGYAPGDSVLERARSIDSGKPHVTLTSDIAHLGQATAIYTDVWASMGQETQQDVRRKAFTRYQVDQTVMDSAPGAVFMHCLPAHRGEEVSDEVIDGPRSVVFQQAGNRLYAQMALMAELFA